MSEPDDDGVTREERFTFGQSTRRNFLSRLGMAGLLTSAAPVTTALG